MDLHEIVLMAVAGVFSVLWYLLQQKDANQSKQIDELFAKHESDAKELSDLKLKIAEQHYPKAEIHALLDNFKNYLNERFDRIEQAVGVERREGKK